MQNISVNMDQPTYTHAGANRANPMVLCSN